MEQLIRILEQNTYISDLAHLQLDQALIAFKEKHRLLYMEANKKRRRWWIKFLFLETKKLLILVQFSCTEFWEVTCHDFFFPQILVINKFKLSLGLIGVQVIKFISVQLHFNMIILTTSRYYHINRQQVSFNSLKVFNITILEQKYQLLQIFNNSICVEK